MTSTIFNNNAIIFVLITVTLDSIGLGIIIPVMPDLLREVMVTDIAQAARWGGLLVASYALTQFAFGPLLGSLSDQFGRRPVLLVGLIALAVDYVIMGFANTVWLLLAGRLLAGAAGSTFVTATAYIADVSAPEQRAANFGMVGAAFGVGFILGPVVGGLIGEAGTRAPFFAAAAIALLNCAYGYFVLPESLPREKRRSFSFAKSNPFSAILLVRRYPVMAWIFASIFLFDIAHFVYPSTWAYWGVEMFDWSTFDIGLSLAAVGVGFAFAQGVLIRKAMPLFGETRTAFIALVITIASFLLYGLLTAEWLAYAAIPVICLGALVTPSISSMMSNMVPHDEQGMLQGIIAGIAAISTIISPLLMTQLFFSFSKPDATLRLPGAPFLAAAILTIIAVLAFAKGVRFGDGFDRARTNS